MTVRIRALITRAKNKTVKQKMRHKNKARDLLVHQNTSN